MIIYIISCVIGLALSLYLGWKDRKEGANLTLGDLLLYAFLTFCPAVNSLYALFGGGWFIFSESSTIVIAGRRR